MQKIDVLLLAAGVGSRLRPMTQKIPKCMVPIAGQPLIQNWIDLLDSPEVSKIIVNLHYLPSSIKIWCRNSKLSKKIVFFSEKKLLGTAGTLRAIQGLRSNPRTSILVAHADNLTCFSLKDFLKSHYDRSIGCDATMMSFKTDTPESCGIINTDSKDRVINFWEKKRGIKKNQANAAVYIFEPRVFSWLKKNPKVTDISTEIIPAWVSGRKFSTFKNNLYHRDIGTVDAWLKAQWEYPLVKKINYDSYNPAQNNILHTQLKIIQKVNF